MGLVTRETAKVMTAVRTREMGEKWRKLMSPTADLIHSGRVSGSEDPQGGSRNLIYTKQLK